MQIAGDVKKSAIAVFAGVAAALFLLLTTTYARGDTSVAAGFRHAHNRLYQQPDGFRHFRRSSKCHVDTRQLHRAFRPLCPDRASMLDAMSGGGRYGLDTPYSARDCDFDWFEIDDICRIMAKFDQIYIVGDSYMRQVAISFFYYLRQDLVDGPRKQWVAGEPEDIGCHCRNLVQDARCISRSLLHSAEVLYNDPTSFKCPSQIANITYWEATGFPLPEQLPRLFTQSIENKDKPDGRQVFIFGHGAWNSFEESKSKRWIEDFETAMEEAMPAFFRKDVISSRKFPRMFLLPHAQQWNKPDGFVATQNNIYVQRHSMAMRPWLKDRGYETLGTYNLTLQASSYDGTHTNMESNLMKVMFLFNWLNLL